MSLISYRTALPRNIDLAGFLLRPLRPELYHLLIEISTGSIYSNCGLAIIHILRTTRGLIKKRNKHKLYILYGIIFKILMVTSPGIEPGIAP